MTDRNDLDPEHNIRAIDAAIARVREATDSDRDLLAKVMRELHGSANPALVEARIRRARAIFLGKFTLALAGRPKRQRQRQRQRRRDVN